MGIIIEDNGDLTTDEEPAKVLMSLPYELLEWVNNNQPLVRRVQAALSDTYYTLREDQLWDIIAGTCSPEWLSAQTTLNAAEARCAYLNSPENASLGLIGSALDSDETNEVRENLSFALANFTLVNEGLRRREDLSKLLGVLMVQKRMLEVSAERTALAQKATADLAALTKTQDADSKTRKRPTLKGQFAARARRMLAPKKRPQPATLMTGPAPSSLKI